MKTKEQSAENVFIAAMDVVEAWTNEEDLKKTMAQLIKHLSEYAMLASGAQK